MYTHITTYIYIYIYIYKKYFIISINSPWPCTVKNVERFTGI